MKIFAFVLHLGGGNCRDLFVKLRPLGKEGPVGTVLGPTADATSQVSPLAAN